MKYLFALLILLAMCVPAHAIMFICGDTAAAPADECDGMLVCQNFEGTGYDNSESWTESGAPDEDWTGTILRGSQSLLLDDNDNVYLAFTAQSEIWTHFLFQTVDATPASDLFIMRLTNGTTTQVYLRLKTSGVLRAESLYGVYAQGGSLADNTTYHIWTRYKKGTGVNAEVDVYYGTSATIPESATISFSNGTGTLDINRITLLADPSSGTATADVFIDQVLVDDASIGSVTE